MRAGERWVRTAVLAALLVTGPRAAWALDPDHALSQYVRDGWGPERGFPGGTVQAISQTPDGYLWVATDRGLLRFDGVAFQRFAEARTGPLSIPQVSDLTADAQGNLWMRLGGPRLLRYHGGAVDAMPALLRMQRGQLDSLPALEPTEDAITSMARGRDGAVLISGILNGVLRWRGTRFEPVAPLLQVNTTSPVVALAEAADGTVWMGTQDDGLFRLAHGEMTHLTAGLPDAKVNAVLAVGARDLWIATDKGVARCNGTEISARGLDPVLARSAATTLALDREANIWVGTARGLLRVNADGVSALDAAPDVSHAAVTALFEDRDGSLWIGRRGAIERLRDTSFTTFGTSQGLPSEHNGPVLVDGARRVWFAPLDGGLFWLSGGRVAQVRADGLGEDVVYSIAATDGGVWVGRRSGALTRVLLRGDVATANTYRARDGLVAHAIYSVHETRDGTVWAGSLGGGLSRWRDGRFTTFTTGDGLASDTITSIGERADGSLWVGTPKGLSAFSNGRWRVYASRDGLPSDEVNCLLEDSQGTLWIGTGDGLAFLDSGRVQVQVPPGPARGLREQVFGLAEDREGWLWVATSKSVLRARREALRGRSLGDGDVVEYGASDGLYGSAAAKRHRSVVPDLSGHIWFSMDRGLWVVDPVRAAGAVAPVVSRIEALTADGTPMEISGPARVPPGARRVAFAYSGVSLSAPEGIRFRYRLDGFDHGWSEPVTSREAVYANLGPGPYRFRVMASNREGLWRGSEAVLGMEIQPTLLQTGGFRLAAFLAAALTLVLLYRVRLHRLTREMTVRFEERLDERTRIAQDLHDTLLQGFLSASMQLHVAVDQVPPQVPGRRRLDDVLALMARVIEEGRNAVRGLRSGEDEYDLEQAFSRLREDLQIGDEVEFRVMREGAPRPLQPMIRDDVYRIGREALINAVRHAAATRIEVAVECGPHHFRLLVRDDGRGVDPDVLRAGRDGHWGLSGMRERAERVGGRLKVWSRPGAGTEVELYVPGHVAFRASPSRGPAARLAAWARRWRRGIPRSRDSGTEGSS